MGAVHEITSLVRAQSTGTMSALHLWARRLVDDCDRDSAECWVINTCTVKSPSQSAMDNLIAKGQAGDKALVVAGCVPQGDRRAKQLQGLSVIGGNPEHHHCLDCRRY